MKTLRYCIHHFAMLLAFWIILAFLTSKQNGGRLLHPVRIIGEFGRLSTRQTDTISAGLNVLLKASATTLRRILYGLPLGLVVGIFLGILPLLIPKLRQDIIALLAIGRIAPLFALIPLWLYWSPGGDFGVSTYIAFGIAMLLAGAMHTAIKSIPAAYLQQARLLGAGYYQQQLDVAMPILLKETGNSLRWIGALLFPFSLGAEMFDSASTSLGSLVYLSYAYANIGQLTVLATVYAALGGVATFAFGQFVSKTADHNAPIYL
jgi:ABC-type nitrate/sulfonate/bicarbonate transport system permease component